MYSDLSSHIPGYETTKIYHQHDNKLMRLQGQRKKQSREYVEIQLSVFPTTRHWESESQWMSSTYNRVEWYVKLDSHGDQTMKKPLFLQPFTLTKKSCLIFTLCDNHSFESAFGTAARRRKTNTHREWIYKFALNWMSLQTNAVKEGRTTHGFRGRATCLTSGRSASASINVFFLKPATQPAVNWAFS